MISSLKNSSYLRMALRVLVVPYFHVIRVLRDQEFLRSLDDSQLRASLLLFVPTFIARGMRFLANRARDEFTEYATKKYSTYIKTHYGPEGRGYFSYESLSDEEKIALYGTPVGRIEDFIDAHPVILNYQDGDTFLDAGCGRGQNIKVLERRFASSAIQGVDISREAVSVIALAADAKRVVVSEGDLTDPVTLGAIEDASFDHVVLSHVLTTITAGGVEETGQVRRRIVRELVRIAKKTVLIIDSDSILCGKGTFDIEQLNRGFFAEAATAYFDGMDGNLVAMFSVHSKGLLFMKANDT